MQDLAVKPGTSNSEQQQAYNINIDWSSSLGLSAVNRICFGAQQTQHRCDCLPAYQQALFD